MESATLPGTGGGLTEAEAIPWRRRADERTLRRKGRQWTAWTVAVLATFAGPTVALLVIEPLAAPAAAIFMAHGIAITHLQARRGARAVVPIGGPGSAAGRPGADPAAERTGLGLLGDLLGHEARQLVAETGLAMQRGELGVWLVGEEGAILVRPGGRRADCWCVRVGRPGELPAADRVSHLLLALREDEEGFATVANRNFSGWPGRVRRRMPGRSRRALDVARAAAREPTIAPEPTGKEAT